jgi:integrase
MKQPTHFYNLESKPNKSNEHLIYINLSYGYKEYNPASKRTKYIPLRISTQWSIAKEYWNDEIYRANQNYVRKFGKDLNNNLERIEKICYNQLSVYRNDNDSDPTPTELKVKVMEKLSRADKPNPDILIVEYIKNTVTRRTSLPNTSSEFWSKSTGSQYTNLASRIEKYQAKKNTVLTFNKLTEEIYWDFFKTINDIEKEESGNYYKQSTIAKDCKHLRAIFNCANEDNIEISINYAKRSLKIQPSKKKYETYLTEAHLQKIINEDVSYSKEFEHARNYIIISSLCGGLRIGDMKHLHELGMQTITHHGKPYEVITTRIRKSQENKEELVSIIPILLPVKKLLTENEGKFPKFPSEPILRKNIKKFLKHLKFEDRITVKNNYYLVDEVEIKYEPLHTLFSPHDCRRTFITNLRQLGIQNDTIEPITHPKIKYASVLDSYDKSTLNDKAIKLINQLESKKSSVFQY